MYVYDHRNEETFVLLTGNPPEDLGKGYCEHGRPAVEKVLYKVEHEHFS